MVCRGGARRVSRVTLSMSVTRLHEGTPKCRRETCMLEMWVIRLPQITKKSSRRATHRRWGLTAARVSPGRSCVHERGVGRPFDGTSSFFRFDETHSRTG